MYRNCEFVIRELLEKNYPVDVVYDIGANTGVWTQQWKKILPKSEFVLFEGNPQNKVSGEKFYNVLLSSENDREVDFFLPDSSKSSNTGCSYYKERSLFYQEGKSIKLKTKTLDALVIEEGLALPDFMKLDTQGSEVDILRGATETLKSCKVVLTEMPIMPYNEGAPKFSEYIDVLRDNNFIPSGVDRLAVKKQGIFNQIDVVFVKDEVLQGIHNYRQVYIDF